MAEDNDDEEAVVELGDGPTVEGAPISRIASRLSWPRAYSDVIVQEGATLVRTADGPTALEDVLADVDSTYFPTRRSFVQAVRAVIGYGPVQTE